MSVKEETSSFSDYYNQVQFRRYKIPRSLPRCNADISNLNIPARKLFAAFLPHLVLKLSLTSVLSKFTLSRNAHEGEILEFQCRRRGYYHPTAAIIKFFDREDEKM